MVLIKRNYRSMSQGNYEAFMNRIHERCATDSQFATSEATVTELGTAIQAYELALSKLPGTKAQTIEKNERKAELNAVMDKLVGEVQLLAGNNPQVVLDAGFEIRKPSTPLNATEGLTKPIFKKVMKGANTGDVKIELEPVKGALSYAIEKSIDGGATWTNGEYPSSSRFVLTGLEPGTHLFIRVKALGRKDRKSDAAEASIWVS